LSRQRSKVGAVATAVATAQTTVAMIPTAVGMHQTLVGMIQTAVAATPTVVAMAPTVVAAAPTLVAAARTLVAVARTVVAAARTVVATARTLVAVAPTEVAVIPTKVATAATAVVLVYDRPMLKRLLLLALIPLSACQPGSDAASRPEETPAPVTAPPPEPSASAPAFTGKVWVQAGSPDLPGTMRIFLADGTLVMDSCWETYRLAQWRAESERSLVVVEDGQEIPTEIVNASADELHLRLKLVGGEEKDEVYRPATVPYVCPDMPR